MGVHDLKFSAPNCGDCPIRHRAVCARCDSEELKTLEAIKYYRSFQAGQTVIWSGDRMDFVASVVTGIATLTQTMEDGRRQMVGLLLPSDFVGRPGRSVAAYDVTATTDLVMCCFRKKPFEELIATTPTNTSQVKKQINDQKKWGDKTSSALSQLGTALKDFQTALDAKDYDSLQAACGRIGVAGRAISSALPAPSAMHESGLGR